MRLNNFRTNQVFLMFTSSKYLPKLTPNQNCKKFSNLIYLHPQDTFP